MIRHYLTFAHQAAALDLGVRGWTLAECWSQEKNVLYLRWIKGRDSLFVEAALDLQVGFALLRGDLHRARRNTIDFFGSLLGVQLTGVGIDEGERVIRMQFADGHELAFFFFGGGGGNVLLLRDGAVLGSFMKYAGEYDAILVGAAGDTVRTPNDIRSALRRSEEPPVRALMRAIPELGRRLAQEALYRASPALPATLHDAGDAALDTLLEEVDVLYGACEATSRFYIYHMPAEVVFALTELRSLAGTAERVETFDSIAAAVRTFRSAFHSGREFGVLRERVLKRLQGERGRMERSLANRLDSASRTEQGGDWEDLGRLLMANLASIPKGSSSVRLADWNGIEKDIGLDPKLAPLENAERYFRRARGAREGAGRAAKGVEQNRAALDRLTALLAEAGRAASVDELERIEKNNRDVFVMSAEAKEPGSAERFRRFEVAGGHEVYAGKNAANNDELTVRFAKPNDYWFHARGSSGSHVVLRWTDTKTKPPKEVIRQAASIAAYYSGARGAKMVPVAYTLKKHVRKPRGAAPGAVVMEREDVVMAEPKLPYGES